MEMYNVRSEADDSVA